MEDLLGYLYTDEHLVVPIYHCGIQLIMRSASGLYPAFTFFQTSFKFWKWNKLEGVRRVSLRDKLRSPIGLLLTSLLV